MKKIKTMLRYVYRTLNPYFSYVENKPILEKAVFYETFFGRSITCGPYTIFRELLADKCFDDFTHIWVVDDFEDNLKVMEEYEGNKHILFVKFKSKEYFYYLATAKYLINNVTFFEGFTKREGQIYINTWHGIPLKKMGYDNPDGAIGASNMIRNFLHASYLLSPNEEHTKMYLNAYRLNSIYEGEILETGQARCDNLINSKKEVIFRQLKAFGLNIDENKKIIMYAPTWKGTNISKPQMDILEYQNIIKSIENNIDTSKYQVLIKPHQAVYKAMKSNNQSILNMIPTTIDTNSLLSIVDILISDYSSIFFDFLVTKRPILFYIPDINEYTKDRGLYYGADDLPGPATDNIDEVANWINNIDEVNLKWKDRYNQIYNKECPYEDGLVTKRIVNYIFKDNKKITIGKVVKASKEKKKILLFIGKLLNNGIVFSLLGFLKLIDYNKYDITLYIYKPETDMEYRILMQIPKEVRIMVHTNNTVLGGTKDTTAYLINNTNSSIKKIGENNYLRMFGNTRYDCVIDFVGYSPLFAPVAAMAVGCKNKIMWQHNDMLADMFRKVNGRYPNKSNVRKVINSYKYFDKIIACSKATMEVNNNNFHNDYENALPDYIYNPINIERIENGILEEINTVSSIISNEVFSLDNKKKTFVTMGRFSTEKNHQELIKGFYKAFKENNNIQLMIIGDGPLKNNIIDEIKKLNMENNICLTGALNNPFNVIKKCDCFILPSLHEGQPMVILEARTLKKDIIVSDFSTVNDILIDNGQMLIKKDSDSICKGILEYLAGCDLNYDFNPYTYNEKIKEKLYRIINNL